MSDGVPIHKPRDLCFTFHDKRGFADKSELDIFEWDIIVNTHSKVTVLS